MTNIISTNEFLEELNNTYFNEEDDSKVCSINLLPFDENAITLPCGHTFNYTSIFNYIYSIKKTVNRYNNVILKLNEIQCPMCRNISDKLLPFIPCEISKKRIRGITSPAKYCMTHKTCCALIKSGKNKGQVCGKSGYHTKNGIVCEIHDKKFKNKNSKEILSQQPDIIKVIWKTHTVSSLKELLKHNNLMVSGNKMNLIERLLENNISLIK